MSVVTTALRELMALGVTGEALLAAVERIEAAAVIEVTGSVREAVELASQKADQQLAARKAKAADRTRKWREGREESVTVTSPSVTVMHGDACDVSPPLPLPSSPQTPQQPTPTPPDITTRARGDAGFSRFWLAYPRKTAKGDARKAFDRAIRKLQSDPNNDPEVVLIGALERAKAAWVDSQFIPHPATWLNGERWDDEPETAARKVPHERPDHDAKYLRRQANYAASNAGFDAVAGRDWKP